MSYTLLFGVDSNSIPLSSIRSPILLKKSTVLSGEMCSSTSKHITALKLSYLLFIFSTQFESRMFINSKFKFFEFHVLLPNSIPSLLISNPTTSEPGRFLAKKNVPYPLPHPISKIFIPSFKCSSVFSYSLILVKSHSFL